MGQFVLLSINDLSAKMRNIYYKAMSVRLRYGYGEVGNV